MTNGAAPKAAQPGNKTRVKRGSVNPESGDLLRCRVHLVPPQGEGVARDVTAERRHEGKGISAIAPYERG